MIIVIVRRVRYQAIRREEDYHPPSHGVDSSEVEVNSTNLCHRHDTDVTLTKDSLVPDSGKRGCFNCSVAPPGVGSILTVGE